ncbi:unnamed protein product [Lepidochelys olivacea]
MEHNFYSHSTSSLDERGTGLHSYKDYISLLSGRNSQYPFLLQLDIFSSFLSGTLPVPPPLAPKLPPRAYTPIPLPHPNPLPQAHPSAPPPAQSLHPVLQSPGPAQ